MFCLDQDKEKVGKKIVELDVTGKTSEDICREFLNITKAVPAIIVTSKQKRFLLNSNRNHEDALLLPDNSVNTDVNFRMKEGSRK